MPGKIEFIKNYTDLSTENGFQFEFTCNRCGTGYRSTFKEFMFGRDSMALNIVDLKCNKCGAKLEIGDKFCPECGEKIE